MSCLACLSLRHTAAELGLSDGIAIYVVHPVPARCGRPILVL